MVFAVTSEIKGLNLVANGIWKTQDDCVIKAAGFSATHDPALTYVRILAKYAQLQTTKETLANNHEVEWYEENGTKGAFVLHDGFRSFIVAKTKEDLEREFDKTVDYFKNGYQTAFSSPSLSQKSFAPATSVVASVSPVIVSQSPTLQTPPSSNNPQVIPIPSLSTPAPLPVTTQISSLQSRKDWIEAIKNEKDPKAVAQLFDQWKSFHEKHPDLIGTMPDENGVINKFLEVLHDGTTSLDVGLTTLEMMEKFSGENPGVIRSKWVETAIIQIRNLYIKKIKEPATTLDEADNLFNDCQTMLLNYDSPRLLLNAAIREKYTDMKKNLTDDKKKKLDEKFTSLLLFD